MSKNQGTFNKTAQLPQSNTSQLSFLKETRALINDLRPLLSSADCPIFVKMTAGNNADTYIVEMKRTDDQKTKPIIGAKWHIGAPLANDPTYRPVQKADIQSNAQLVELRRDLKRDETIVGSIERTLKAILLRAEAERLVDVLKEQDRKEKEQRRQMQEAFDQRI